MVIGSDIEISLGYDDLYNILSLSVSSLVNTSNNGTDYFPFTKDSNGDYTNVRDANWTNMNIRIVSNSNYNYTLVNGW